MKKKYKTLELSVTFFLQTDIVTLSQNDNDGEDIDWGENA